MNSGRFMKPEQHADNSGQLLRACASAIKFSPAPPSILTNRRASLWHTDIIAAGQNKPQLWPAEEARRAARGCASTRGRRRRRAVRHVLPSVNTSCKMEPRRSAPRADKAGRRFVKASAGGRTAEGMKKGMARTRRAPIRRHQNAQRRDRQ